MRTHARRHDPESLARVRSDRIWPVMAGALTAIGLLVDVRAHGFLGTAVMFVGLWFFFSATLYGVLSELGFDLRRAVVVGRGTSLTVMALVGLLLQFPVAGWLAAGVCALTSPPVVDRTRRFLVRTRRRFAPRRPAVPVPHPPAPDQAAVDQKFEEIVADLHLPED